MIGHRQHLDEDRLYEAYFAARAGEAVAPPVAEHLADCHGCHDRFAAIEQSLDAVRAEGDAEVDEIFHAERLQLQRAQILQKLDLLNRSARVISFPTQLGPASGDAARRVAPRWIAGSAAAGLFVGIALGGWLVGARGVDPQAPVANPVTPAVVRPAAPPVLASTPAPDTLDDETFLRQLEMALAQPRTRELQPFDAFTPHLREVQVQTRLR